MSQHSSHVQIGQRGESSHVNTNDRAKKDRIEIINPKHIPIVQQIMMWTPRIRVKSNLST